MKSCLFVFFAFAKLHTFRYMSVKTTAWESSQTQGALPALQTDAEHEMTLQVNDKPSRHERRDAFE